jgi:hypothetical protein
MSVSADAAPVNDLYIFTDNGRGEMTNKDGKDKGEQIFWDMKVAVAAKKNADAQAGKNDSVPYYDGDERGWGNSAYNMSVPPPEHESGEDAFTTLANQMIKNIKKYCNSENNWRGGIVYDDNGVPESYNLQQIFQDQLDKDKGKLKAIYSNEPLQYNPSLVQFVAFMSQELNSTWWKRKTETMRKYREELKDLRTYVTKLGGRTVGKWRIWS